MILCDLIIDGNYILNKNVFTLHKNNLLFGALYNSLENTISNYKKWYPFTNVYLVSDSKQKSWRKNLLGDYKSHRKKDSDIDWSFVYKTYEDFKANVKGLKVLESPSIEGDDWISLIISESNKKAQSNVIITNDHDIKQLLSFSLDPLWINFMTNEMYNQEKLFLPKNYQLFVDRVNKLPNDDIFNLNDNSDFLTLFNRFINKYQINEIDSLQSLIIKVISGDVSDNIQSVFQVTKNGKTRGIGSRGSQKIIDSYLSEFGELDIKDFDLLENIADLICESKKVSKSNIPIIVDRLKFNLKIIDLRIDNLPDFVKNTMISKI